MNAKWTEQYRVNSHDTDYNGVIRASNLLRYHQESAHRQLEAVGPTQKELEERGQAFLLSRVAMSVYAPLREGDALRVETWACESRGVSFHRCGRIWKGDRLVAELISIWALLDVAKKHLVRVSEALPDFPTAELLELDLPVKFRIPADLPMSLSGEYTVSYGVTDRNRHMNNTFYPDLLCDFYPGGMAGKQVISFSINYVTEAPLGETVKVYVSAPDEDGRVYYRTIRRDGKVGIEAEMMTEEL